MPSEIEIYGAITVFGIRVSVQADDERLLRIALTLFPQLDEDDVSPDAGSVYVVLKSYGVNYRPDSYLVEGSRLAIDRDGIGARADGEAGRGRCEFPSAAPDDSCAEMINTVVLFLVAHAGRIPLHASAIMLDDTAVLFAGRSGSGKSTLALAASRAGLTVLSDDTIFVQTAPRLRLWSLPSPIHVFEKDAPADAQGGMRLRAGRWKKSLLPASSVHKADRAILCVLARGAGPALEPISIDEAVSALTANPEPGYEFYGERSAMAARALADGGCWRLTLSGDPAAAIALVRRSLSRSGGDSSLYCRYTALIAAMEKKFPLDRWRSGDADLWPLARFDLYLDMQHAIAGQPSPQPRPWPLRWAARLLQPLRNLWHSRRDLSHAVALPRRAPVIFLGDGVSLDCVDGAFQDRCGEPLMAALEKLQQKTFLMQGSDLSRLPRSRPTFAANVVEAWGSLIAPLMGRRLELPAHQAVLDFLAREGVRAPSLSRRRLGRRGRQVRASALLFEAILSVVRPRLAFVVSYYAGLGPAFVLACRRRGVMSIDLQHAPLQGAPMAYRFHAAPETGYSTLPALFWSWTPEDAASVQPGTPFRHRSFYGGHPQLRQFLNDEDPATQLWDGKFAAAGAGRFEREILVALQPLGGHRAEWEALAAVIETAPAKWRWWIRRHPASRPAQDREFGRLLTLSRPNVLIAQAACIPLPAILRNVNAVISLASGTAAEAAMFGVPAFFLSPDAREPFANLIDGGLAEIITIGEVRAKIAGATAPLRPRCDPPPDLAQTLARLTERAGDYTAPPA